MKRVLVLCMAVMLCVFSVAAQEQDPKQEPEQATGITGTSSEGMTIFQSTDGKFKLELDGRLQLGAALYSGSVNPLGSGTEVRRARMALKPTWGDWNAQFDLDFSGNAVEIKDFWVAFNGFDHLILKAGNHKTQWSLEEVTSSRYITFMERADMNAFTPDRRIGLSAAYWRKNWRLFGGVFGQSAGEEDETGEKEALGYNFRLTAAPILVDNKFIHVGGSYAHVQPSAGSGDKVKFSSRPESHVTMAKFLTSGKISNVTSWDAYGLELAAVAGPVLLQGEYSGVNVKRYDDNPNAKFDGYYAYVSWFVTGEKRQYNSEEGETCGRVIPKKKSLGTFEVAARYSCLDLNDPDSSAIMGGKGQDVTLAANWYPYANLKFSVNYIFVNNDANATGGGDYIGNDDFHVLQFGLLLMF